MSLADAFFSDLLLFEDGRAMLKGCPGEGSHLVPVPEDCTDDVRDLPQILINAVLTQHRATLRIAHAGLKFRVASIQQEAGRVWFLRRLAEQVPALETLGLRPYLTDWLLSPEQSHGLVLFSGSQASGKTTVASALVARRLTCFGGHAVTFECPAELPLSGPWGTHGHCFQTEIAKEGELAEEIEHAHRYASPDIIFIGEIRTKYAALEALRVAQGSTRQMVVATIHGLNVTTALERLIAWARELDGQGVCHNLANALLAVVHLTLDHTEKGPVLQSPEHLLLPHNSHQDKTLPIRSKLREGEIHTLHNDMKSLRSHIMEGGRV